ncbi:MAG: ribose transport system permease protein [Rhodospirillaceae bacterium]|jgi:ribose transport system permease protein|nr:ribose transport system permease protein [Rhodospirillaceae bacterium]
MSEVKPNMVLKTGLRGPGTFIRIGILPLLLVIVIVMFASTSPNFLTYQNLFNVVRQSSYLIIVTLGQLVVLLTAGLDLSVGSVIALVSVVSALVMGSLGDVSPGLAIAGGVGAGLATGIAVGAVNGLGVTIFRVNPFMMTLGMLSIAFGLALTLSGGTPIYGMPASFGDFFGYGSLLGIPAPVCFTAVILVVVYLYLAKTRAGRYVYAIGSNNRAAELSGVNTRLHVFAAYVVSGVLAAAAGILLTARVGTGEANIGQDMVLQSIAACIIGGVSLFGGVGRVGNVVLSALFIALLTNGMNLVGIQSYTQQVVLGVVLISAIILDQLRLRYFSNHAD